MKLLDAYNLLVEDGILDNHRYFAEVYKLFQFRDDQTLKEYLDFVAHEPVAWMEGFPSKLTTKQMYSKPKTAIIKLLKKEEVVEALGSTYVEEVHDKIWNAFKKEHQRILTHRQSKMKTVLDHFDTESCESLPLPPLPVMRNASVPSLRSQEIGHESLPEVSEKDPEERIRLLKDVLIRLSETLPTGAADAFRLLLEAV
jgi:hypothetical protein